MRCHPSRLVPPRLRALLPRVGALLLLGGCAAGTAPWQPGNLQPLVIGWQQYFHVQWAATPQNGTVLVDGYVTNVWGFPALSVRLLVTGYDASGRQTGQRLAWGPNEIDPGNRVYFNITVPPAASYDVAVFAWNWVQTGNGGDLR
jgi:hypothetical protein